VQDVGVKSVRGKLAVQNFKSAAYKAMQKAKEEPNGSSLGNFLHGTLPAILKTVKDAAKDSSEVSKEVSVELVSLLREFGDSALEEAIHWVDEHENFLGPRLHDFVLSSLQEALMGIAMKEKRLLTL